MNAFPLTRRSAMTGAKVGPSLAVFLEHAIRYDRSDKQGYAGQSGAAGLCVLGKFGLSEIRGGCRKSVSHHFQNTRNFREPLSKPPDW